MWCLSVAITENIVLKCIKISIINCIMNMEDKAVYRKVEGPLVI